MVNLLIFQAEEDKIREEVWSKRLIYDLESSAFLKMNELLAKHLDRADERLESPDAEPSPLALDQEQMLSQKQEPQPESQQAPISPQEDDDDDVLEIFVPPEIIAVDSDKDEDGSQESAIECSSFHNELVEPAEDTPLEEDSPDEDFRLDALKSLYRRKVKKASEDVERFYEQYYSHPEQHRDFQQEWKNFYLQRSYEIASSQPHSPDYRRSWEEHWAAHLRKLQKQELLMFFNYFRKDLNLPDDIPISLIDEIPSPVRRDSIQICDAPEEYQPEPKRRRTSEIQVNHEEGKASYTEKDRMIIAYQLALNSFQERRTLTLDELSNLVSQFCSEQGNPHDRFFNKDYFEGGNFEV